MIDKYHDFPAVVTLLTGEKITGSITGDRTWLCVDHGRMLLRSDVRCIEPLTEKKAKPEPVKEEGENGNS